MSAKKDAVRLSDADLDAKVDRIIAIRPMANEYRLLCAQVNDELKARNSASFIYVTAAGNTAQVKRTPVYAWLVEKLFKVLPKAALETLCPRKPDARKLNQRLAATPEDKKLAACKVLTASTKAELEVLAKGETAGDMAADEYESEAA